jgi:pilus assembly protein CpaE
MPDLIEVLVAGRSAASVESIAECVSGVRDIHVDSFVMTNGTVNPLAGLDNLPDILVLQADADALEQLAQLPAESRPELLVVGAVPTEAMRFAIRAGARDLVDEGNVSILVSSLQDIVDELLTGDDADRGQLIAVMNAKGGSGATFIATSLAHMAAVNGSGDTVVIDLDCQFGSLPDYLDTKPKRSFIEALAHADELDRVAIDAFAAKHSSGLHIMAPLPDMPVTVDFSIQDRMRQLFEVLRSRYRHIVVDLPRHVDDFSQPILQTADQILMVTQQSLPSIRDAVRLKTTLIREMGLDSRKLHAVVNRHTKSATIELDDVKEALGESELLLVPNHFKVVGQSIEMGLPVAEVAPNSPVTKALLRMQEKFFAKGADNTNGASVRSGSPIERLKQWSPF